MNPSPNHSIPDPDAILFKAAAAGDIPTCHLALMAGANLHARDFMDKSVLHVTAVFGHAEACQWLVEAGADANAKMSVGSAHNPHASQGKTPLHLAAFMGNSDVCDVLIGSGANLEARDENNQTPFCSVLAGYLAFSRIPGNRHRHRDCLRVLSSQGADVNATNTVGQTTLHYCVLHWNIENNLASWANLLLDLGVDPWIKDHYGQNAIELSRDHNGGALGALIEKRALAEAIDIDSKSEQSDGYVGSPLTL